LSEKITKLTDFPYSNPGYGRKVAVVGVGSAGCKIASQLSKESKLLEHFVYLTCDDHDVANITKGEKILVNVTGDDKYSPYSVRGIAHGKIPEIKQNLVDSDIVFIIAGLGGTVGSGLAPLVAREARAKGAVTVAVLVMPYVFEKAKHFHAGAALKQIKDLASGVVVIDNDELLQQDMPIIDAYAAVNQKIALALNKLLGSTEEHEFSLGLNNVVNFVKTNSYSVMCLADCQLSEYKKAVMDAADHFRKTVDASQASKSLVHLCTEKSITMTELSTSIGGLSGVLGSGTMQIEYGLSANSTTMTTAIIMATGFRTTKFDQYDPIDAALKVYAGNLESDFDSYVQSDQLLTDLEAE
jgi:cell division protein FtsZ